MKRLLDVLLLTFAVNFIVLAVAVVWLFQSGRVDPQKATAIRDIVFPTSQPTTQPAVEGRDATTQPTLKLEELLAKQSGRSASEQVQFIQRTFDSQMALLDRRQRELTDLQRQVDLAKTQMARDRAALRADRAALTEQQTETARLAEDKGFQDTLELYKSMPAKNVKEIFLTLDDATVVRFLKAMEPRQASKILKEFKAPDEVARAQKVLEKMRQPPASSQAAQASVKE
jgi:flagellar motility protein MotE (MotC chaperone)